MKTGKKVNHEGSRKISCPMRERTHCPQKYISRMSSTQCVHMKKKRIVMLPTSALMWQHYEKNSLSLKKTKIVYCTSAGRSTMPLFFYLLVPCSYLSNMDLFVFCFCLFCCFLGCCFSCNLVALGNTV